MRKWITSFVVWSVVGLNIAATLVMLELQQQRKRAA